jgi:hypothetical protein
MLKRRVLVTDAAGQTGTIVVAGPAIAFAPRCIAKMRA